MNQSQVCQFKFEFILAIENIGNNIAIFPHTFQMKFQSLSKLFLYPLQCCRRRYTPKKVIATRSVIAIPMNPNFYFRHSTTE